MVKVKAICRNEKEYVQQTNKDLLRVQRNPSNTVQHPFQQAREYQRALNAAKLEKLFAKPFLASMDTHSDGVVSLAKNRHNLTDMLSAAADGEIIYWNLPARKPLYVVNAHPHMVRGLAFANNRQLSADTIFVSTGDDKKVNIWSLAGLKKQFEEVLESENKTVFKNYSTRATFTSKHMLQGLDHSYGEDIFATAGSVVQIWSYERSTPLQSFEWGVDTVTRIKFNPSEINLIASTAMDRSICLFDIRGKTALQRITLKNKSSALAWNPYEPMNFVVGNENGNCYTFDMRKLSEAKMVHKDHVQAILDVDFAPTGREFVTASFDKTIRIFPFNDGRSREVYHTKRMQQVNSVLYSMDSRYIITGSEDTNVRIWKARASDPIHTLLPREKEKLLYNEKLKKKYKYNHEIKRILRHRHLPKSILKKKHVKQIQKESRHKKVENIRANNRPEDAPFVSERKKDIDTREDDEIEFSQKHNKEFDFSQFEEEIRAQRARIRNEHKQTTSGESTPSQSGPSKFPLSPQVIKDLQLLNVPKYVSREELKKQYHKLAKIYHPDILQSKTHNQSTTPILSVQQITKLEERFKEFKMAYDRTLKWVQERDQTLEQDLENDRRPGVKVNKGEGTVTYTLGKLQIEGKRTTLDKQQILLEMGKKQSLIRKCS